MSACIGADANLKLGTKKFRGAPILCCAPQMRGHNTKLGHRYRLTRRLATANNEHTNEITICCAPRPLRMSGSMVEIVAAKGFLPPGAKVRGAAPSTGNTHPCN